MLGCYIIENSIIAVDVKELFESELSVLYEHLGEWLAHNIGRFVPIKEAELLGPYDTQNDAITVGYETHGNVPFLTKQITPFERPAIITRLLVP